MGCNGGPATMNQNGCVDEVEFLIEKRSEKMKELYKKSSSGELTKNINDYWKPNLYGRSYVNNSSNNNVEIPNTAAMTEVYHKMLKYSEEDKYNCAACGYGSCEQLSKRTGF